MSTATPTLPSLSPRQPRTHRRRTLRFLGSARNSERLARENLLLRAEFLPACPRALVSAYFGLGMSIDELATLHHLSRRQLRRRLNHFTAILSDPCFLLAARFHPRLPRPLADLARAYWLQASTLRDLAHDRRTTLHRIRRQVALTRSLLVLALSAEQALPPDLAESALSGFPVPQPPT